MRLVSFLALTLLAGLTLGCARSNQAENPQGQLQVEEGQQVSKNPFQAMSQLSKAAEKAQELQKELEALPPVDPVHYDQLLAALPPAPKGYEAEKPHGEKAEVGDFKISWAERAYRAGDKSLTVKVADNAHHSALYAPFVMAAQFSQESTERYQKDVTLNGNPGIEQYHKENRDGELTVLVGKRFVVEIRAHDVPPEFLREVYASVDVKKLAELANAK